MFDTVLGLDDLRERYPSPPAELVIGTPPLIHHGYSLGRLVVCIKACQEAMAEARQHNDQAATTHLQKHMADFQKHSKEGKEFAVDKDAAARRRGTVSSMPPPSAAPANAH